MKRDVTYYDKSNGKILFTTTVVAGNEESKFPSRDFGWVEGDFNDAQHRIDLDTGVPVPLYEFDLTVTSNRIDNIPAGTTAVYLEYRDVIDTGYLEFECEYEQKVHVILLKDLYAAVSIEVLCEA